MSLMEEFHREFLGMPWKETDEERQLRQLAEFYHDETEAHDRRVCSGPIVRGSIMPVGPSEYTAVQAFARELSADLRYQAAALNFTGKQWQEAVTAASYRGKRK